MQEAADQPGNGRRRLAVAGLVAGLADRRGRGCIVPHGGLVGEREWCSTGGAARGARARGSRRRSGALGGALLPSDRGVRGRFRDRARALERRLDRRRGRSGRERLPIRRAGRAGRGRRHSTGWSSRRGQFCASLPGRRCRHAVPCRDNGSRLREVSWPGGFDWTPSPTSDGVVARLGYGDGASQVGRVGGVGTSSRLVRRASTWRPTARSTLRTGCTGGCWCSLRVGATAVDPASSQETRRRRGRRTRRARGDDARARGDGVRWGRREGDRALPGGGRCRGADRAHAGRPPRVGRTRAMDARAFATGRGTSGGGAVTGAGVRGPRT